MRTLKLTIITGFLAAGALACGPSQTQSALDADAGGTSAGKIADLKAYAAQTGLCSNAWIKAQADRLTGYAAIFGYGLSGDDGAMLRGSFQEKDGQKHGVTTETGGQLTLGPNEQWVEGQGNSETPDPEALTEKLARVCAVAGLRGALAANAPATLYKGVEAEAVNDFHATVFGVSVRMPETVKLTLRSAGYARFGNTALTQYEVYLPVKPAEATPGFYAYYKEDGLFTGSYTYLIK